MTRWVPGQDTAITSPRPVPQAHRARIPTGRSARWPSLERWVSEAIELHAMEQAPNQQGTWTGPDEQPLGTRRVRVLYELGGLAARRRPSQACVGAGPADLAGPVSDGPRPRVGCHGCLRRVARVLAPQRLVDSGQVVELDRLQVGGMH
jgi:hypothetical protein